VPERTAETSLLYSCCKQISVKKPKNKKEVVVQVYAYYHKDIDATEKTASLSILNARFANCLPISPYCFNINRVSGNIE
jgi:hypothetical protein